MTDRSDIINSIIGQLECDLFLGARWLPIGEVDLKKSAVRPRQPAAKTRLYQQRSPQPRNTMPKSKSTSRHLEEKRRRLEDVARRVAECHECPLHETRTNVVPGEGNPDARIVFIGEAPGQSEDEQGRPFVGRAGILLTSIIEAMGLRREDVFIGNILKCRPPGNRDPQTAEIMACIGFLHEQLEIIDPEIIVALGAHAARTLLNTSTPIGQLRGRIHEYVPHPLAKPIRLVATYHPAYLLRSYTRDNRMRVWQDMQRVLQELDMPVPRQND